MIQESDLHAYLDDCLPAERRGAVEAHLAAHPDEAARLQAYRAQSEALRAHFAPIADEALPESLLRLAEPPVRRFSWLTGRSLQRIAAGVLLVLLGGAAGWFGHGRYADGDRLAQVVPLPRQAAIAHVVFSPDMRRPVEVSADQEEQLVKWLSKRLGTPVNPPKLGGQGFELVGGRLLPGNSGPVAQFMYQDAAGQRLTLYVTTENASNRDTGFRFAREGQVNVFYWVDGKFGYALSAGIGKGELAQVASAVYDQLEGK